MFLQLCICDSSNDILLSKTNNELISYVTLVTLISAAREVLGVEKLRAPANRKQVLEKLYKDELFGSQLQHYFAIFVARKQDPKWRRN